MVTNMTYAYCYRSGEIEFGDDVPEGAISVLQGDNDFVRERVTARARHGYRPGVLLVPGIPEAADEIEAERALTAFMAFRAK